MPPLIHQHHPHPPPPRTPSPKIRIHRSQSFDSPSSRITITPIDDSPYSKSTSALATAFTGPTINLLSAWEKRSRMPYLSPDSPESDEGSDEMDIKSSSSSSGDEVWGPESEEEGGDEEVVMMESPPRPTHTRRVNGYAPYMNGVQVHLNAPVRRHSPPMILASRENSVQIIQYPQAQPQPSHPPPQYHQHHHQGYYHEERLYERMNDYQNTAYTNHVNHANHTPSTPYTPYTPISPTPMSPTQTQSHDPALISLVLDLFDVRGIPWMDIADRISRYWNRTTGSAEILNILVGAGRMCRMWWD
ncbi:hypothetical protein M011DRAFT_528737 [Sporormia fimetaria CBS 119925]|uniref:Uncharacterized protein n=1 Tax=Sporormia fimetaria CBS 119925 TaxID=1340428 RepID=A0A6A6V3V3_9PLEO|nr:hypothetical protein M011DRAFT_528737 [Sporormia fimetaria CBS 119925]